MSKGKNQHVVKHHDGWAVKGAGNEKATKVTRTQQKAINSGSYAKHTAINVKFDIDVCLPFMRNSFETVE